MFGARIGRIVKTYDYINRVVIKLSLSVYEVHGLHSSLSLLCITMILRVRRNFLKLLRSPTAATSYTNRMLAILLRHSHSKK